MARGTAVINAILQAAEKAGLPVRHKFDLEQWATGSYPFFAFVGDSDERELEELENGAVSDSLGMINAVFALGVEVKKNAGSIRDALDALAEIAEANIANLQTPDYKSDYERCRFSPVRFVAWQKIYYADSETKGLGIIQFQVKYQRATV